MSIPTTQKALVLPAKQAQWALQTIAVPTPGPGELLVRVEATALNPSDWKNQVIGHWDGIPELGLRVPGYPMVMGSDGAGVVVQVGDGVTSFAVGDRVFLHGMFFHQKTATFQQYAVTPADITAKIPSTISLDEAASIPLGLATTTIGLYGPPGSGAQLIPPWRPEGRGKYTGQPILIFGGSSVVGTFAIQLAKLSGFSPIITTVSPRNYDLVKRLGATHTIDRRLSPSEIISEIRKIVSEPLKLVYDAISIRETLQVAYEVTAPGATILEVLEPELEAPKEKNLNVVLHFGTFHVPPSHRVLGVELFSHLTALLESGDIKPRNVEVIPGGLAGIPNGLERLKNNDVSAVKLVVHPQETL
ncbi:GroES-like protein [Panus rudis PR-1116 ss-1]|nr:GroES-like protein [Panus rudis PR-1116 ss-1]